ncbi:MAG: hypothetical protein QM737_10505 [Ferruginibacter sp.]
MRKIITIAFLLFVLTVSIHAQASIDKSNVESLCGCFNVEFKYAETFSPDTAYKYHNREEISGGTELVMPVEVSENKIVMQHLLVIDTDVIVKHWREDWTYENPVIYKYQGNKVWTKSLLNAGEIKGKWTQSIWEVSDEPRYQGIAAWNTIDGKTFWLNTTDAPLPRREYSVRSDYNVLRRTNKINITGNGYIHEQDNQKIIRANGIDKLLVEEKGINSYERISDSKCAPAKAYWEKYKLYWTKVKSIWDDYVATHDTITLKTKVGGKVLHQYLYDLAKDYSSGKLKEKQINDKIKEYVNQFTSTETSMGTN